MPRVVISDTSPLRYLVLIGHSELLCALYAEVLIPEAVLNELIQPATPDAVRRWITQRPSWLKVVPPIRFSRSQIRLARGFRSR